MGWMSWTRFFCELDCIKYPNACINEQLYMQMADRLGLCIETKIWGSKILAEDGYRDVGYKFVHIDDCWLEYDRSVDGKLVANRTRFASGMDGLAKYVYWQNKN